MLSLTKNRNKNHIFKYDQTLGFPVEGWTGWSRFKVAAWNTHSLTKERFLHAKSLAYDILALTELWRHQGEYQTSSNEFIVSEPILHKKGSLKGKTQRPWSKVPSGQMQVEKYLCDGQDRGSCRDHGWLAVQGPMAWLRGR